MIDRNAISNLIESLSGPKHMGQVIECVGMIVEADCKGAFIGEICQIESAYGISNNHCSAEVIGFRRGKVLLMPYYGIKGIKQGDIVRTTNFEACMKVSKHMLGRVVDAFGEPIDGKGQIAEQLIRPLDKSVINPLQRSPISEVLETGIRAIDGFTSIGKGQRVGLLAGSGVGKSSLVSSICKNVKADVNVIALIGERGREVEEFVRQTLGEEGLQRSVIIAATAQESPLIRAQAAYGAIAVAEYFAEQGKDVFFSMDSITRFATAMREVGLAAGEPPTTKGYTPSVFSAIPHIIEKCGNFLSKGSISAVFTVLVESDDFNDPVVDSVRAILDGHIVMSRKLAEQSHYPAIDISKSVSRLYNQINEKQVSESARTLRKVFTDYQDNRDILELGLFESKDMQQREKLKSSWLALETFLTQEMSDVSALTDTQTELVNVAGIRS